MKEFMYRTNPDGTRTKIGIVNPEAKPNPYVLGDFITLPPTCTGAVIEETLEEMREQATQALKEKELTDYLGKVEYIVKAPNFRRENDPLLDGYEKGSITVGWKLMLTVTA